ncbi:MAG: S9 family peptidase [Candidatus Midichloria mitochondrii]|nr:S9 family peptidase [Candidatus Midichloria mitochondrii]
MTKPIALRKEYKTIDGRIDYYHWLRDPNWPDVKDPEILSYLNQENAYTDAHISKDLVDKIFIEMRGKLEEADKTVPYLNGWYYYYSYILEGQQYWIHARKKENNEREEILLEENQLALNEKYLRVSTLKISPDHKKIAYLADYGGDERYMVYVKDIESGEIIENNVDDVIGNIEWDGLGKGFFYTPAGKFWRADRIYYHEVGKEKKDDKLLYQEKDNTFSVAIEKSSSKNYIFFMSKSATASEYHFIDSRNPHQLPQVIHSRTNNHIYEVVHTRDSFFLRINDVAPNFRVIQVSINDLKNWQEFVPSSDYYIQDIYAYEDYLVLLTRLKGRAKIEIINLLENKIQRIDVEGEFYEIFIIHNTFNDRALRYLYSSLKTPRTTIDYDFVTGEKKVLKVQRIPGGFDPSKYILRRIWAETSDNISIPISIIYNKEKAKLDGSDPLYLYGYGSYGYAVPASFRSHIFSLVDRGFTYAIAHIRGGDELGKSWHEAAKFLNKKNTFTDFIESAEKLIEDKYTAPGKIVISGGSAGGMLVGACINMRPELYKAAVAHVPFVDVLSTMLDESLPLTPGEFKEWGNPKEKEFYEYIKSYSPYDNVVPQRYPHLFVTAGLTDPRVTYWEPAKWVALLRHTKKDDNMLLLKTDMSSGHGGPSGRFEFLRELALEYAFILGLYYGEQHINN